MPVVTELWLKNNQFTDLLTVHKMYGIFLVLVAGDHMLWICNRLKHHFIIITNTCENHNRNIWNHSRNAMPTQWTADLFTYDQEGAGLPAHADEVLERDLKWRLSKRWKLWLFPFLKDMINTIILQAMVFLDHNSNWLSDAKILHVWARVYSQHPNQMVMSL